MRFAIDADKMFEEFSREGHGAKVGGVRRADYLRRWVLKGREVGKQRDILRTNNASQSKKGSKEKYMERGGLGIEDVQWKAKL